MSVNSRKILFLFSLLIVFTIKHICAEEEEEQEEVFTIDKFNEIINGDSNGEYKIGAIKPLLFIIDNFEISHLFWPRKVKGQALTFGLSCCFCPFPDVIELKKNLTISFFSLHINFIRFILHTIRFFFHFYYDYAFDHDKDLALLKSVLHSLLLNTHDNVHLFAISCYNVKIYLFSVTNILTFCGYVIGEYIDKMKPFVGANNNTHDSGNNNNTNNNENNNTDRNSPFFINFKHHSDCYIYTTSTTISTFDLFLKPFKGSSRLYLLLYPRIEIFL